MNNETNIFYWGAATSSHQVEGGNTNNDWFEWESSGKLTERSGAACDHYRRFESDFSIAKSLGHNAHRLSLEWSRLEPSEGVWDEAAWAHYRAVLQSLRSFSIEPFVTLNHFTLPIWIARRGGWLSPSTASSFARFAAKVIEKLGNEATYWITLNEPLVHAFQGHSRGVWPPGTTSFKNALTAIRTQAIAHALAYKEMRRSHRETKCKRPMLIGISHNVNYFMPEDPSSIKDRFATTMRNRFYNHAFVHALISGRLIAPPIRPCILAARGTIDFIGLNYYTAETIRYKGLFDADLFGNSVPPAPGDGPMRTNSLGWRIYPEGLYRMVKEFGKYRLPIIITENGICTEKDDERTHFIEGHLERVFRARAEGVPLQGYFYWSLLDNFEWAEGFGPRFGLVGVDYASQSRAVRPSAYRMSSYIRSRAGSQDTIDRGAPSSVERISMKPAPKTPA